jgi:hypothetical protein
MEMAFDSCAAGFRDEGLKEYLFHDAEYYSEYADNNIISDMSLLNEGVEGLDGITSASHKSG